MIKPIKTKIRKSGSQGLFHNSREDVEILSKVCNEIIRKVNELTEEVNRLTREKGDNK